MAGFEASIVVGLYLKRKEHCTTVTKYNEDTGVPYQKPVTQTYWETANGQRITFDLGAVCGFRDNELQLYQDHSDRCVIGCPAVKAATRGMEMAAELPIADVIATVRRNVEQQLQALGCDLAPTVLLVAMCG